MTLRLTLIDELIRKQHHYLEDGDLCYCFGEYTARQGAAYSKTNQLIINLKKGYERRAFPDYHYKKAAIEYVAQMLISNIGNLEEYTFVPVPPSKCRTDAYQISVILRNTHLFPYHHPNAVQMPLTMTV
ncbi:hypothetical protein [Escherichia coli]|uniref:hypothetical protein n=1 Tax=Escherichia coli TaxID=562 RepID=UPI000BB72689|nr:hypothetical protein [Escherichia coli]